MPRGLSDRQSSPSFARAVRVRSLVGAVGLAMLATACNSLANPRFSPRVGDVRTVVVPDPGSKLVETPPPADLGKTTAPGGRASIDRLDDESPLPPALDRPTAPPANATPVPVPPPEATPLLDEALSRAQAETRAIVEEALRDDPVKPIEVGVATIPKPGRSTSPPSTLAPAADPVLGPPASPPIAQAEPKMTEELWHDAIEQLRAIARQRLKESGPGAGDSWSSWRLRERVLGWLDAVEIDPDPLHAGDATRGRAVLRGLTAALDVDRAPARGADIRAAVSALEIDAPLEITELKLCRKVIGFGHIEPLEPAVRKPGQSVVVYCELAGVCYQADGASFRSEVAATVEILPEHSETPIWSEPLGTAKDACLKRRRDYYVNYRFNLPESLVEGTYRIRLIERDLANNRQASRETPVAITR